MGIPQKSLVIGACEIACHYPELSLNDAAGDALQLAEKIRLYGIEENQKKETVFIAACRFVSADKDLTPQNGTSLKHDGKAILENGKPMGMCSLMGLGRGTR